MAKSSKTNRKNNIESTPYNRAQIYAHYRALYRQFSLENPMIVKAGKPVDNPDITFIIFFTQMIACRIFCFQTMYVWLTLHETEAQEIGFSASLPNRTTLLRRFKKLAHILPMFIAYVYKTAVESGVQEAKAESIYFDSSMFKAMGSVWHSKDREENHIPEKLRSLDKDACWGKSGYHWFVYGYKVHVAVSQGRFPICIDITPANVPDSKIFDQREDYLAQIKPQFVVGDNGYFSATRVKRWKEKGIFFVTPATSWTSTKPAKQYHSSINTGKPKALLIRRKVVIEPIFDVLAKVIGATANHKQLSMASMPNVKCLFLLGFLALQIIMRLNLEYQLPQNTISYFLNQLR